MYYAELSSRIRALRVILHPYTGCFGLCFWVPFLQVRGELALFVSWTALPAANWAESTLLATLSRLSFAARLAFVLGALSLGSSLARWFTFAFVTTGIASSVCIVIALGKAV